MLPQRFRSSKYLVFVAGTALALNIYATVSRTRVDKAPARDTVSNARGKALFTGAEPLTGRIREHDDTMPATVLTCSNCHGSHTQPAVKGSDAPVLSTSLLNNRRSRRHGPESVYDEHTFCRVLRTGVDPVSILLDHTMPVYQLNDTQCQSLWRYLQEPDVTSAPKTSHV